MLNENTWISARFGGSTPTIKTRPVYQYDHGLTLNVYGLENVDIQQVHFSNAISTKALNILCSEAEDGSIVVPVPDTLLAQNKDISAYLYYEDEDSGYTERTIIIPLIPRAKPENVTLNSPTLGPVNQLTQQLQDLIQKTEEVEQKSDELFDSWNEAHATATTIPAGESASVNISYGENGRVFEFMIPEGSVGETGPTGPVGPVGPIGPQGNPGKDFQVLGVYDTYVDLVASVTDPAQGDHYDVGTAAPYTMYMWDANRGWVNKGTFSASGTSLPEGGSEGQILTKNSSDEGDASWQNPPTSIPAGGEVGQVLTKNGTADGDAAWKNLPEQEDELPEGGTAGQILARKSDGGVEWVTPLAVDSTLKEAGKAADAKATGDALSELNRAKLGNTAQAADSKQLNGKDSKYYVQVFNWLDNSYFTSCIDQKGKSPYTVANEYCVDRWFSGFNPVKFTRGSGFSSMVSTISGSAGISQKIPNIKLLVNNAVTLAFRVAGTNQSTALSVSVGFMDENDTFLKATTVDVTTHQNIVCTYTIPSTATVDNVIPSIRVNATAANQGVYIYWAALYKGTYTVSNIPDYMPKPEATELLECQRHYLPLNKRLVRYPLSRVSSYEIDFMIPLPIQMRGTAGSVVPTLVGTFNLSKNGSVQTGFWRNAVGAACNAVSVRLFKPTSWDDTTGLPTNETPVAHGLTVADNLALEVATDTALDRNMATFGAVSSGGEIEEA